MKAKQVYDLFIKSNDFGRLVEQLGRKRAVQLAWTASRYASWARRHGDDYLDDWEEYGPGLPLYHFWMYEWRKLCCIPWHRAMRQALVRNQP